MKQVMKKTKVITLFLLAIAYLGCEDVTNLFPDVTSAFTYTINEDTGTVAFINISEEADTYFWDFGDGGTSTEINPVRTYAASGTYTVTLKATNVAGASDTSQDEVTVTIATGGGGGECTAETTQSLDAADFNLTFQTDPGSEIIEDGGSYSYIDNPDPSGINTSCKVGEIVRDASLPFANNQIVFDSKFDFNANSGFKMKVWAPIAGTNVLLKLEDKTDSGINTEVGAVTVSGNAWEELTFDFPDTESGKYDKIVLFFDINTDSGATYYIDDLALNDGSGGGECTAETAQSLDAADFNLTFQTDPGSEIIEDGGSYSYIDNPDPSGINTSCKVGEIVRDASLPFANNQIVFDSKLDFTANSGFKLKVWAPVAGTNVLLKLEDKTDSGINTEVGAVTVSGNAWEELTFDFPASESDKYDKIVLFFDINTTSGATYYIDDFALYTDGGGSGSNGCSAELIAARTLPVDFEGCETFLSSENFGDGIVTDLVANPFKTGINTSDFVLQIDKPAGSSFFAGIQNTFENNFDLTTTNVFKLKVYSTKANVVFRFELLANPNDGSIGNPAPVFVTVPNANEWTEVEFTFINLPAAPTAYRQLVIKPDNDQADSAITVGGTYYIDDLTLSAPSGGGGSLEVCTGGELINDFETADNSIFNNFGGGVGTIIDNPDTSVNTSAKVGQYVKNAGEVFAGITIEVNPDIDFNAGVFSIDVKSQAVRQLLFKLEGLNIERIIPTSGTGWETITYDFSAVGGNIGAVTAITLIMDNGTAGDGSGDWTIQFDNIRLCSNESTGGGGSLADCGGDLINDFETADNSIFNNFGGGVGTIIDNPDTSVNTSAKVGQYVKNAGEPFGGITIEVNPDIDFNAGVFSIDVNSQAVRQLLFKLEGLNIERIIPTSGTGWETITYDFSAVGGNIGAVTAITLIMDNGTQGDGSGDWTIQFDNIRLCSNGSTGGGGSLADCGGDLINDFETADNSIFNNFGGGVGTIIDNPDTSVNTSAKVGQYVKNAGEPFGGITIEVNPDINFNAGVFSIDVSSQAVRQLLFKLEGLNIERIIPTSGTGWETITYDFSAVGGNVGAVTAITLIMDNGTQGDGSGDWTIQFDNIRLCSNGGGGGGTGGNLAGDGDFESGVADPWILFQNGGTAAFDNTINNGGTWSGRLATGGPSNPAFKQERVGAGTVAAGDVVQVQFDHIGSVVQPGAVFNVLLFGEGAAGASFTHVFNPAPSLSGSWTTFTGTFTIPGGTDVSEGISFLIEAVCGGDAGCSVTANIDNVSVTLNP